MSYVLLLFLGADLNELDIVRCSNLSLSVLFTISWIVYDKTAGRPFSSETISIKNLSRNYFKKQVVVSLLLSVIVWYLIELQYIQEEISIDSKNNKEKVSLREKTERITQNTHRHFFSYSVGEEIRRFNKRFIDI